MCTLIIIVEKYAHPPPKKKTKTFWMENLRDLSSPNRHTQTSSVI